MSRVAKGQSRSPCGHACSSERGEHDIGQIGLATAEVTHLDAASDLTQLASQIAHCRIGPLERHESIQTWTARTTLSRGPGARELEPTNLLLVLTRHPLVDVAKAKWSKADRFVLEDDSDHAEMMADRCRRDRTLPVSLIAGP